MHTISGYFICIIFIIALYTYIVWKDIKLFLYLTLLFRELRCIINYNLFTFCIHLYGYLLLLYIFANKVAEYKNGDPNGERLCMNRYLCCNIAFRVSSPLVFSEYGNLMMGFTLISKLLYQLGDFNRSFLSTT